MKTLKYLSILALLTIQVSSYAQSTEIPDQKDLFEELTLLNTAIDSYFEEMVAVKSSLEYKGLKITNSASKMPADLASKVELLENQRLELTELVKGYRFRIEDSIENSKESTSFDVIKALYNIALVKSFLPRLESAKSGLLTRIFASHQPQLVDELLTRGEALNLFFTDFENANELRFKEFLKIYNSITDKINRERGSVLFQVYPSSVSITNNAEEASFYKSIIRGEELKPMEVSFSLNKTGADRFELALANCASLFGI